MAGVTAGFDVLTDRVTRITHANWGGKPRQSRKTSAVADVREND
jgi:hypothetical protein